MKEYVTSMDEMNRRKKAFFSLEASFFLSAFIIMFKYVMIFWEVAIPITIISLATLIFLYYFFKRVLDRQGCLVVSLSDTEIERRYKNACEKYSLENLKSVNLKRNTQGIIREMKIGIYGEKYLFINGLVDSEGFKDKLISVNNDIKVETYKEPIDFDHVLFYPILGTIIGSSFSLFFRFLLETGSESIKSVQFFVACFLIGAGVFLVINKPTQGRYGNKHIITDLIMGGIFLVIGILAILS